MDMNRGRNYYACGGFGYMVWHCRNRGVENRIGKERRLEYRSSENNGQRRVEGRNKQNNLNRKENLIVFN